MKDFTINRKSSLVFCDEIAGVEELLKDAGKVYIVYDVAVEGLVAKIPFEFAGRFAMKAVDEAHKTMEMVMKICDWLLEAGADRNALVVAMGGGIVTDVAGFAASIYKRGVRCAYVPTTLLSQVDAAIGGKTGVNYLAYKNMMGTFKLPEFTFICRETLESLPFEVFREGLSEMLKTFVIDDGGKFDRMVSTLCKTGFSSAGDEFFRKLGKTEFFNLVEDAAMVKSGVVSRDFLETGERTKLNLGHTFAHAIEWCAAQNGDRVSHGEAVAVGLAMAARLSVKLGMAEPAVLDAVIHALETCCLPTVCPYSADMLAGAMTRDKKADGGKMKFVLVKAVGDVVVKAMETEQIPGLVELALM